MAAGQNLELCHTLTALQNRHIDCNRVPFSIGIGSITSEILVNALSDRYTHWSSVHKKKQHSCKGNETESMRIEINYKPENQQHKLKYRAKGISYNKRLLTFSLVSF